MDFHEVGFGAALNGENGQPFWFQMSDQQRQQAGSPWGPANPQALNRYSYVLNGPMKATDPSGHSARCQHLFGIDICWAAVTVVNNSSHPVEVTGDAWDENCSCYKTKTVMVEEGRSSRDYGIADTDRVRTINSDHPIDGHGTDEYYDPSGTGTVYLTDDDRPDHAGEIHEEDSGLIYGEWKKVPRGPKGTKE